MDGFKQEYVELSLKQAEPLFAAMRAPGAAVTAMMIEIDESAEIKSVLDELLGIDARDYVRIEVGPHVVVGAFEHGHSDQGEPGRRSRLRNSTAIVLAVAGLGLTVAGCSESAKNPLAERGRQVYLSQCTACHATDPAQPGPIGPSVKGSSRELLEARILRADYPAGYVPKRSTKIMPAQPQVAADIPALSEYLK